MENIVTFAPSNIAIRMEVDRRRELLAELELDDTFLTRQESQKEEEVMFNPFQSRDFIIIILELCPPESLSKLYRTNKYIRSIIAENPKYLQTISEYKYHVVSIKYENLLKAYKAREDVLLSLHTGISKAIKEEEDYKNSMFDSIQDFSMTNSYLGYRNHKLKQSFFMPHVQPKATIGTAVKPSYDLDQIHQKPEETKSPIAQEKEPYLDDLYERQKLASLQSLIEHQKKIERDLPLWSERKTSKHGLRKSSHYTDDTDFELQFRKMKIKKEEEINKRKIDLLKAHEVDIKGIECLSIFDDKESTVTDVIDAF